MRCGEKIAPNLLMCKTHWYQLPQAIRLRVLRSYRPGQERDGWEGTTAEYQQAVRDAVDFMGRKEGFILSPVDDTDIS